MTVLFGWFHIYGLLIGLGVFAGIVVIQKMSRYFRISPDWLDRALLWIFAGALIGARAYHLLTDWRLYQGASLLDLVAVWRGGIGFIGGVLGGGVGLWSWYRRERQHHQGKLIGFFVYLDLLAFGIPLAQIVGRLGNWVNGELYGLPTTLPWGIWISGVRYHPLFLYESVLNLGLFFLLLWLGRSKKLRLGKGQYASVYLFGYSFIRFWLEYLRLTTARWDNVLGFLSIAQWVCLLGMMLAAIMFWTRRHAPGKSWDFSFK